MKDVREKGVWRGGFYNNPDDPRVMVPKRFKSMGWTFNMAHPMGKVATAGILVLVAVALSTVTYGALKDYEFTVAESQISIDAPMYGRTFNRSQVVSVSVVTELPGGRRTNGYGGINKGFGHFNLEGYGKSMLYVYKDVDMYIVVKLKDSDKSYVIFNDRTVEKTTELYNAIKHWSSK